LHSNRKRITAFIWGIVILFGCSPNQKIHPHELSQTLDLPLVYSGSGHVHGLDLELEAQGNGVLKLLEAGKTYKNWKLQGSFRDQYHGDWYSPEGRLIWQPTPGLKQGQIKIKYQFRD
jgi:hypothetical protein